MDTMSFIFRAYHAMARQRPMSTKKGVPTAATYVFVNMLRKLRADFNPEYLAAVFDVAGPTFRDEQARTVTSVRKFDIKTQTFRDVDYLGYKAQRKEMPPDLVQQVPYIRRALEAYQIPILEQQGFEADDVIGTLARKAAAESYEVFVVSSDKDMLQLVNETRTVTSVRKFDIKTQTFRDVDYLGYKAQRKEMPPDLVQQVPYIRRALEAYQIPILEQQGFEADDVIGTLARKAAAESYRSEKRRVGKECR